MTIHRLVCIESQRLYGNIIEDSRKDLTILTAVTFYNEMRFNDEILFYNFSHAVDRKIREYTDSFVV